MPTQSRHRHWSLYRRQIPSPHRRSPLDGKGRSRGHLLAGGHVGQRRKGQQRCQQQQWHTCWGVTGLPAQGQRCSAPGPSRITDDLCAGSPRRSGRGPAGDGHRDQTASHHCAGAVGAVVVGGAEGTAEGIAGNVAPGDGDDAADVAAAGSAPDDAPDAARRATTSRHSPFRTRDRSQKTNATSWWTERSGASVRASWRRNG